MSPTRRSGTSSRYVLGSSLVAEVGGEHPQADLVVVVELVEGVDRGLLGEVELGGAGRPGRRRRPSSRTRRSPAAPGPACAGPPSGRAARRAPSGSGTSSSVWGWSGSTPLLGVDRRRRWRRRGCRAGSRTRAPAPGSRARWTKSMNRCGARGLVVVDPLGVEDEERVVGVERALLRVDRHERHPRRAGLLAGLEHAVGVAGVVVDDRLLLDGDGRHVAERVAPLVGPVQVVQERQRGVAVVDDGRLDAAGEVVGGRAWRGPRWTGPAVLPVAA